MKEYVFDKELKEAIIIKRNSQFTMNVLIDGREEKCHCPATTRIGDVDVAGLHCLVSESSDPKRKLKYTVEAISMDDPDEADKNWVGINLILSNRIVEFLLRTHQLDNMVPDYDEVKREVFLGKRKFNFRIHLIEPYIIFNLILQDFYLLKVLEIFINSSVHSSESRGNLSPLSRHFFPKITN